MMTGSVKAEPSVTGLGPPGSGSHSRARASSRRRPSRLVMSLSTPAIACSMTSQEAPGTGGGASMPSQARTPGRTKVPPCGIIIVTPSTSTMLYA
jgi:hypothetical protein